LEKKQGEHHVDLQEPYVLSHKHAVPQRWAAYNRAPAIAPQAADTPCAAEALQPACRCRPVRRALMPHGLRIVAALRAAAAGLRSAAVLCAEPHAPRAWAKRRCPAQAGHRRCSACDRAPRRGSVAPWVGTSRRLKIR